MRAHGDVLSGDVQKIRELVLQWIAFVGIRRIVAGVGTAAFVVGVGWFVLSPSPTPVETVLPVVTTSSAADQSSTSTVRVHVAGAVQRPGVYELPGTSRVIDALKAAGGSLASADLEGINLAQTIVDAEQVFIPRRSVSRPRVTVAPRLRPTPRTTAPSAPGGSSPASRTVNINTATSSELESLTGVGPATARAIVVYRTSKGPFSKVEDLLNVPGIGPAKLSGMRNEISVS